MVESFDEGAARPLDVVEVDDPTHRRIDRTPNVHAQAIGVAVEPLALVSVGQVIEAVCRLELELLEDLHEGPPWRGDGGLSRIVVPSRRVYDGNAFRGPPRRSMRPKESRLIELKSTASASSGPAAVVLLSGGLDSATVLAIAASQGRACHTLAFDYGQRHRHELAAAERISNALGAASHRVETLRLGCFGGSALTSDTPVPKDRSASEMSDSIPVTYVPARNLLFLAIATAYAETLGAKDIFLGVNAVDYSGYPDCRPEFIASFERTARLATRAGVLGSPLTIHAPLIDMSKAEIIRTGARLGVDYGMSHSCYDPVEGPVREVKACGRCDSCQLRRNGFIDAGVTDPTAYAGA